MFSACSNRSPGARRSTSCCRSALALPHCTSLHSNGAPSNMAERLYNRLLGVRTERGLTQAGLAELVGVSRKTINTVENGIFIPSTLLALKLAQALGRPVEDLFSLEPDRQEP